MKNDHSVLQICSRTTMILARFFITSTNPFFLYALSICYSVVLKAFMKRNLNIFSFLVTLRALSIFLQLFEEPNFFSAIPRKWFFCLDILCCLQLFRHIRYAANYHLIYMGTNMAWNKKIRRGNFTKLVLCFFWNHLFFLLIRNSSFICFAADALRVACCKSPECLSSMFNCDTFFRTCHVHLALSILNLSCIEGTAFAESHTILYVSCYSILSIKSSCFAKQ